MADALARRALELRSRPVTYAEKRASKLSDVLTSLGSLSRDQPELAGAGIGGLLGAGAGAGHVMLGNIGKEEEERRGVLGTALTGGLTGAAVGGGVGLARRALGRAGGPQGLSIGDALVTSTYTDPVTGKKMQIDPAALRANPDLARRIRELSAPALPLDSALRTGARNVATFVPGLRDLGLRPFGYAEDPTWIERNFPVSHRALPAMGAMDLLLHSKLNLGERFGVGRIRPEFSTNPAHLIEGIAEEPEKYGIPPRVVEAVTKHERHGVNAKGDTTTVSNVSRPVSQGSDVAEALGRRSLIARSEMTSPDSWRQWSWWKRQMQRVNPWSDPMAKGEQEILTVRHTPDQVELIKSEPVLSPSGAKIPGLTKSYEKKVPGVPVEDTATRGQLRDAKARGFLSLTKKQQYKDTPGLLRVGSKTFRMPGKVPAFLARLGIYGTPMLADYAIRGEMDEFAKERELREIMGRIAKEVPPYKKGG